MKIWTVLAAILVLSANAYAQTPASQATREANVRAAQNLPQATEDEEFVTRGFMGTRADPIIRTADGRPVWNLNAYDFVQGPAPDTVHPSLWRHARLLAANGLFRVADRVYQIRGFDAANMTIIVGDTGFIICDPLTSVETARAALALAREHLGDKPVVAVIYSHSHADHFGGVRGVVEQADVAAGRVRIIAPAGFLEHAVGENLIAGPAMTRRAQFQFGAGLQPGPQGAMTSGIGGAVAGGTRSLIAPTELISTTRQELLIDGVRIEFQLTPDTEAPAEMNAFFPDFRVLWIPENANATMHNVLTPRGALVRDSKRWADYLTEALAWYGPSADAFISSHAWPRFGAAAINDYLAKHRDAYKYLHDQAVRMMNDGMTGEEIANVIALPDALNAEWYNRGYYGTMQHNSRAVYQRYMGFYDANPVHLNPLPESQTAARYVEAMGGEAAVLRRARRAYDSGDYRWAAELLNHVVFANPNNTDAREHLARTHEQMAYQAESAIWRNMYLFAAAELRGRPPGVEIQAASLDFIVNTPTAMLLDLLSVRVRPNLERDVKINFNFPERRETFAVSLRNGVLVYEADRALPDADVRVTMPRASFLMAIFAPPGTPVPPPANVDGDRTAYDAFMGSFAAPQQGFNIVLP